MKQVGKVVLSAVIVTMVGGMAVAQEKEDTGVNQLSVREINEQDIMMKKTLWRRVDLNEKQNQAMFSKNNEITRYLIDAVKAGVLTAYENDSVTRVLTPEKLAQRLAPPEQGNALTAEEIAAGFSNDPAKTDDSWGDTKGKKAPAKKPADDGWGASAKNKKTTDDGWGSTTPKKKNTTAAKAKKGSSKSVEQPSVLKPSTTTAVAVASSPFTGNERFANEFSILEIKEDWVFDRKRSRLYYDIQSIGIVLPADKNPAGLEIPIAYFRYKELDKLFRSDRKRFIWYNAQNQAQHKNLADAFDLRLFYGRIYKVSNPQDRDLIGQFGDVKEGLMKSYQTEYELMEAEHGLWEY